MVREYRAGVVLCDEDTVVYTVLSLLDAFHHRVENTLLTVVPQNIQEWPANVLARR